VIRAVVFDFDGVIANSEPFHFRAFRDVLAARGIPLSERDYYDRYLGFDDVGAFTQIAADCGVRLTPEDVVALVERKARLMEELERGGSLLFPGARAAVERMAGVWPLAIASGALRDEITRVLDQERLTPLFRAVVAAEDTARSKPAPDPYERAVQLLGEAVDRGLTAGECVAIEDSQWGLESARAAGLHTIGVAHSYPPSALTSAEVVISHLDALTEALIRAFPKHGP
jgi:beta-phosphoglucomutase-like phosphatase (HAD superfamily)